MITLSGFHNTWVKKKWNQLPWKLSAKEKNFLTDNIYSSCEIRNAFKIEMMSFSFQFTVGGEERRTFMIKMKITSNEITSNEITSNEITSNEITSNEITSI